jgi:hypothetical protein
MGRVHGFALLSFLLAAGAAHASEIALGDAAYEQRALGASSERAAPGPIIAAVRAYELGLAASPDSLEVRWKLLRALYFQGDFATREPAQEKRLFERATALADESVRLLERRAGDDLARLSDAELRARLASAGVSATDAAALYFWSAVAWGVWSQTHGLLDAVRKGVAARVHAEALLAHRIDPGLEEGGPLRLLARLHAKLPRVPLISGFVDRAKAEPLAAETRERWPAHPGNRLLLALTWLELAPERREEALALLREVAASEPRRAQQVEDAAVVEAARERLAQELALGG